MARRCIITGKRNNAGNNVSHSNRKTRRVQKANVQTKRIFVPELGKHVRIKLSTRAMRTLNKKPLVELLKDNGKSLADLGVAAD